MRSMIIAIILGMSIAMLAGATPNSNQATATLSSHLCPSTAGITAIEIDPENLEAIPAWVMDEEVALLHQNQLGKHIERFAADCAHDDVHFLAMLTKEDRQFLEKQDYGLLADGSPAYAPDGLRIFMKVRASIKKICNKTKMQMP